jgi:serine/threonine protein kinase
MNGQWVTPTGWTAWSFVEGTHATNADIPKCIAAIEKLHLALDGIAKNPLLDESQTPWAKANTWCLGNRPSYVHPILVDYVTRLYELRKPIRSNPYQVIHGDLNPENILVAPDLPPAFIDFSPFWAPPELAIAIFANWIGPRRGDAGVLRHFEDLPNFAQLLIRAAIRMLLVMSDAGELGGWQSSSEKKAADMVLDFALTRFA